MKRILIIILSFIVVVSIIFVLWFNNSLGSTPKGTSKTFTIESGSTVKDIIDELADKDIIRNADTCYYYAKFNKIDNLQAGSYGLREGYGCKKVLKELSKGNVIDDSIKLTFIEGKRLTNYAKVIAKNYKYTEEEILKKWSDKEYLQKLIDSYWFLTDEILNDNIYYALEGYLYPDTYQFNKDATIEDITTKLLDMMGSKLEPYKDKVSTLNDKVNSVHKVLTLASIVELEGAKSDDRAGIAGVFYNRLNSNMSLGSDVTTYYAARIDFSDRDLRQVEIEEVNAYNTRPAAMAGKLPVGPICNPNVNSIDAVFNHKESDYYFFVADKYGKTYFTKTNAEHEAKVAELKSQGLWYEYK